MIVHLIDGTYELFRHFFGIRRFRKDDPPFGAVAVFYSIKARKQRRDEGRPTTGVTITLILGILEILGGLAGVIFILYAIGKAAT